MCQIIIMIDGSSKGKITETKLISKSNEINNILAFNADLASEVSILKNASINNLNNNIFFEDFKDLNSINLKNGCYDAVNKRLVI